MLLFAFVLGALVAAGVLTQRLGNEPALAGDSDRLTEAQVELQPPSATATSAASFPSRFHLEPLWSTSIAERFPRLLPRAPHLEPLSSGRQIISYYGNPYSASMGILGAGGLETIGAKLEEHAALYDQLNGPLGVVPAMHLVYAVAQYHPTDNGLYLQYVGDDDVRRYVAYTREHDMLLFIDLQIGRSTVRDEIERVLPYLRYPHVHLALDPEFAVSDPEVPGTDLGSLNARDINDAQQMLDQLAEQEGLPPKLLIVHQFADSMLQGGDAIESYPNVELIFDMDGFGPAAIKRVKYEDLAGRSYATNAGIKLFFDYDPDLMSEEDVLRLQPTPALVIYQ